MAMLVPAAQAHTASDYYKAPYGGEWPLGSNVTFYFYYTFPSGNPRARVIDGFSQWNFAANTSDTREPDFTSGGQTSTQGHADDACKSSYNGVYWRDLDYIHSTVTGFVDTCDSNGVISRFGLSFDQQAGGVGDATDASRRELRVERRDGHARSIPQAQHQPHRPEPPAGVAPRSADSGF